MNRKILSVLLFAPLLFAQTTINGVPNQAATVTSINGVANQVVSTGVINGVAGQAITISGGGTTTHARSFNGSSDYLQSASSLTALGSGFSILSVAFDINVPSYTNTDLLAFESSANYGVNAGSFYVDPNSGAPASGYFALDRKSVV